MRTTKCVKSPHTQRDPILRLKSTARICMRRRLANSLSSKSAKTIPCTSVGDRTLHFCCRLVEYFFRVRGSFASCVSTFCFTVAGQCRNECLPSSNFHRTSAIPLVVVSIRKRYRLWWSLSINRNKNFGGRVRLFLISRSCKHFVHILRTKREKTGRKKWG